MFEFDVGVSQWQGKRAYQQDRVVAQHWPNGQLLGVLCDGMGGTVGGEIAAQSALDTLVGRFDPTVDELDDHWLSLAGAANNSLARAIRSDETLAGMGTTLVSMLLDDRGLRWMSIGDSPLWLYRRESLTRLNIDESYGGFLDREVASGKLAADVAKNDRRRHQLMNVVQGKSTLTVNDISDQAVGLKSGDIILLASDGLQSLSDDHIAHIIQETETRSAADITEQLMRGVHKENQPKQDNVSIVLIKVQSGSEEQ